METPSLKDQEIFPTEEVLMNVMGDSYPAYEKLIKMIKDPELALEPVWNYYRDGKAWLCKNMYKKKNIFWLSVWEGYFKTAFYFTDKNKAGIDDLEIDEEIKKNFKSSKYIGKLIPLVIDVHKEEQIDDVVKIAGYKKQLK